MCTLELPPPFLFRFLSFSLELKCNYRIAAGVELYFIYFFTSPTSFSLSHSGEGKIYKQQQQRSQGAKAGIDIFSGVECVCKCELIEKCLLHHEKELLKDSRPCKPMWALWSIENIYSEENSSKPELILVCLPNASYTFFYISPWKYTVSQHVCML